MFIVQHFNISKLKYCNNTTKPVVHSINFVIVPYLTHMHADENDTVSLTNIAISGISYHSTVIAALIAYAPRRQPTAHPPAAQPGQKP